MSTMDYRTALALAEQLIQAGKAGGQTRESLVSRLLQKEQGGAQIPQAAIGNVIAQPPLEMSPAMRAPVMRGIPLIAPRPTAPPPEPNQVVEDVPQSAAFQSRFRPMIMAEKQALGTMESAITDAIANKKPVSAIQRGELDAQRDVVARLERRAALEEGAFVPEEMLAVMKNREARLGRREELLQENRARAPFEALIAGGAALAAGRRGERFTEALARGLQAGTSNLLRSQRLSEDGIESIGEARDQTTMDRLNALSKARETAVLLENVPDEIKRSTGANRSEFLKNVLGEELVNPTIQNAIAGAALAQFRAANAPTEARVDQDLKISATEKNRLPPKIDNSAREADLRALDKLAAEYTGELAAFTELKRVNNNLTDSNVSDEMKLKSYEMSLKLQRLGVQLRNLSSAYKRRYGVPSGYITIRPKAAVNPPANTAGADNNPLLIDRPKIKKDYL